MEDRRVIEVVMPQMGVSVSEGTVTRWLRNVGDPVAADETLLEVSTDKVDSEVPSPGSGVLREILVAEGETVGVGTVLARIGAEVGAAAPSEQLEEPAGAIASVTQLVPAGVASNGPAAANSFVSPVVARIVAEHGIDVSSLTGTGHGGRVTKKDVLAFVEGAAAEPAELPATLVAVEPPAAVEPVVASAAALEPLEPQTAQREEVAGGHAAAEEPVAAPPTIVAPWQPERAAPTRPSEPAPLGPSTAELIASTPASSPPAAASAPSEPPRQAEPPALAAAQTAAAPAALEQLAPGERLEPMSVMRRGIAAHMRRSLDTAAHVTSAIEVDMSRVAAIREQLKEEYVSSYGVNPTFLAFVARAVVETLHEWPLINAELRDDAILTRNHVNLGFAVALEKGKGLIVPVLKHAEGLNLLGVARGIADLADRARTKKLLPDDVQGGTFTITNPGVFGTLLGTPIINQPQSAILGTYAIVKRPWVILDAEGNDVIAIRSIMNLTLTYDHRLVDGAYGAQFLRDLANRLQTWSESDY